MRGPRPTATSSRSASSVVPSSSETCTPASSWVTPEKRTPVLKAMPRLRNARSKDLVIDSSSLGTSVGSASTMVTLAPNEVHTLANSQPMTPPPSTTTDCGT